MARTKSNRGLASADAATRKRVARQGGLASGRKRSTTSTNTNMTM